MTSNQSQVGMAELRTIAAIPLNGSNYRTWKVQHKMALMKENLWKIVKGSKTAPDAEAQADLYAKFVQWRNCALGTYNCATGRSVASVHPR